MSEHTVHHTTNPFDTMLTVCVGMLAGTVSKFVELSFIFQCANAVFFAALSYGTKLGIDWVREKIKKRRQGTI